MATTAPLASASLPSLPRKLGIVGIKISKERLAAVLERAVVLAESDAALPDIWARRVERIGDCPSKTYIAALGTALLAKASDPRVDVLTVKSKAGPNGYSMRGVVKVMVEKAPIYGYHLGRTGPEPLNNQPWFGADRIDRFENVRHDALPYHRDMVRYLTELNAASAADALDGLAVFLRIRLQFAEEEQTAARSLHVDASADLERLIQTLTIFVRDDPEGGRRGQALVAALFDIAHGEVHLAAINDPTGLDVSMSDEGKILLGVEVKQKVVVEATALHLAEEAARRGVDKALLVALASEQHPLDRERVRRQALAGHGVLTSIWEGIAELVTQVALQSSVTASEFANEVPTAYLRRMQEHGVSREGQQYWADVCAALAGIPPQ